MKINTRSLMFAVALCSLLVAPCARSASLIEIILSPNEGAHTIRQWAGIINSNDTALAADNTATSNALVIALGAKQDAATAATDSELSATGSVLQAAINLKADAAGNATDADVTAATNALGVSIATNAAEIVSQGARVSSLESNEIPSAAWSAISNQTVTALQPVRNRVVIFGDSLTAANGGGWEAPNAYDDVEGRGYFNWARAMTHCPLTLVTNLGYSGNTTSQMVNYVDTVLDTDSDIVLFCGGRNDVLDWPVAESISNITSIITSLQAGGKRVVVLNVTAAEQDDTTEENEWRDALNNWIAEIPRIFPGVAVVDAYSATVDFATSGIAPSMTIDGTHWSMPAAALIGKAVADVLNTMLPQSDRTWYPTGSEYSAIANPSFGSSGTGWTLPNGNTVSYTNLTGRYGDYSAVITTTNTANGYIRISREENISSALFTNGQTIAAMADIEWSIEDMYSDTAPFRPIINLQTRNVDGSFDRNAEAILTASNETVTNLYYPKTGRGIWRTCDVELGTNVNRVYTYLGFQGATNAIITIHRASVFRVD